MMFRRLRAWGTRVVYTVHEPPSWEAGFWRSGIHSALVHSADRIIVPSQWGKQVLTDRSGLDPARVHVIPLGNLDDFRGQTIGQEQAREALGVRPAERTVLFFGRLMPDKGLDVLIRAFSRVKARIPEARLLIAANPLESFSRYEQLIARLGLASSTTVRLGFIPQRELATWFCAADVVALPYLRAYHSANLLTAYTFGRPVVATAVGGLPEDMAEGRSGHVVPPGNEETLAQAICAILSDDEKLEQMGRYARHLAETKHAWPRITQATLEAYKGSEEPK
jgi:glycosyltransferase involved in cell wall biosynthesis